MKKAVIFTLACLCSASCSSKELKVNLSFYSPKADLSQLNKPNTTFGNSAYVKDFIINDTIKLKDFISKINDLLLDNKIKDIIMSVNYKGKQIDDDETINKNPLVSKIIKNDSHPTFNITLA